MTPVPIPRAVRFPIRAYRPRVPSSAFYKFPKAVIDNGRRRDAHRQLDECERRLHLITGVFYRHEPIGRSSICPFVCPSVRSSVRRSACASGISDATTSVESRRRCRARRPVYVQRSPNIYGGQSQISGVPRAPFD